MCGVCGCGDTKGLVSQDHKHNHAHHSHDHDHGGADSTRHLKIEQDILAVNNGYAAANRQFFGRHKILALNVMSSPGSGKTTLLARTLSEKRFPAAVIEGDQSTDIDAERLRATGAPAVQINTGRGCHLDAHMVGHAMEELNLESGMLDGGVLFIENVGNLVCPAAFDLGEALKVVLLSVTEGDDKPLKYPDMFRVASLMILTKSDLLPHVSFDVERCLARARQINPEIECLTLSSTSGEGFNGWQNWLDRACGAAR